MEQDRGLAGSHEAARLPRSAESDDVLRGPAQPGQRALVQSRSSAASSLGGFARPADLRPPAALGSRKRRLVQSALRLANRLVPKDPARLVLFSSVDLDDGLLAVAEEAVQRGCRPTLLLAKPERASLVRSFAGGSIRTVPKQSLRGLLSYLSAGHVFATGSFYGTHSPPPPGQVTVNLWHGEPPAKVVGRFGGRGGIPSTWAPVCSTLTRAYRAGEFDLHPLQVPVVGAPRNDRMLRSDRESVRAALLGPQADRTTFLWMPAFRVAQYDGGRRRYDVADPGPGAPGVPFGGEGVRALDEWLTERGARMVVKLHHRDAAAVPDDLRAVRVLRQGDLERLGLTVYTALPAFDALVTDVSSIWIDHLLLDRPQIFAFPDIDDYRRGRGINLEPYEHWVPGPFARTLEEMLAAMGDVVEGRDVMADERRRARLRQHAFHDDGSTTRLLDGLGLTGAWPART